MTVKLHRIGFGKRFVGLAVFAMVATVLSLWFVFLGVFSTATLPDDFTTKKELIGMVLMLILLPAYLAASLILGQRRSVRLAEDAQLTGAFKFADKVAATPVSYLIIGFVLGLGFSTFNLPKGGLETLASDDNILVAIGTASIILWATAGLALAARYHVAHQFYLAGKQVKINIFEMSNLKPFGQEGLTDALLLVVAFAITTLQSLDAQFRAYNYFSALIVMMPAIIVLMVTPMYSLHRRIVNLKNIQLRQINDLIFSVSEDLSAQHINQLEPLLQRRERLDEIHTWPLDMAVVSRLLLYVIVPPLAWLGSAAVEIVLDNILG